MGVECVERFLLIGRSLSLGASEEELPNRVTISLEGGQVSKMYQKSVSRGAKLRSGIQGI